MRHIKFVVSNSTHETDFICSANPFPLEVHAWCHFLENIHLTCGNTHMWISDSSSVSRNHFYRLCPKPDKPISHAVDFYLIVFEGGSKNALYFRFIQRVVQSLVNVNFVFPITINSQPRPMIQLLLCSLLAMPRLCNYLCRWQWLSSALADSLR